MQQQQQQQFEQTCLERHNFYRAKHGSPPLKLNRELCDIAQRWANHLASTQSLQHSQDRCMADGQTAGENLYLIGCMSRGAELGKGATTSWYNEIEKYDWSHHGFSMQTGHFTQVVWRATSMLGVASAIYRKGNCHNTVVVANYSPAGNYPSEFENHVPRLL